MEKSISLWRKIPITEAELCIDTTLRCGQSFRWKKINDKWHCSLHGRIVSLRQESGSLYFRSTWPMIAPQEEEDNTADFIKAYFNLQLNLSALYEKWSQDDANFKKKAPKFSGVRILNQDAWETLVCFICSSNNNISRISQMAHKLCLHYGRFLGTVDGEKFYEFPHAESLAAPSVEKHLRELGFGYRAKYIAATARVIAEKGADWLTQLRNPSCPEWPGMAQALSPEQNPSYKAARDSLVSLNGVGPKVADCVCLMGLGWGEAVPVDTHMWNIAVRDYRFKNTKSKTLSLVMYEEVGSFFRRIWGQQAGWAQSVLFTANLKSFSDRLVPTLGDKVGIERDEPAPEAGGKKRKEEADLEEGDMKDEGKRRAKRSTRT